MLKPLSDHSSSKPAHTFNCLFMVTVKIKKFTCILIVLVLAVVLITCQKEDIIMGRDYPRITTLEVTNISVNGATFAAEILSAGLAEITEYGFAWSAFENPYSDDLNILSEHGAAEPGIYSMDIKTNLETGLTYYVQAFVVAGSYTVFGKKISFIMK